MLTCGSSPYARANVAGGILIPGSNQTGPITIAGSLCQTTTFTMTPNTMKLLDVPDKTPIHLLGTQTGSYPSLSAEQRLDKDSLVMQLLGYASIINVGMVATNTDYTPIDSRWSQGTEAALYVLTAKADTATGACADVGGITYTVMGHAETIAAYSGGGTSTASTGGGGATLLITTTGTTDTPELVTIVGTKTGCTIALGGFSSGGLPTAQTGKLPAAKGATSGTITAMIGN